MLGERSRVDDFTANIVDVGREGLELVCRHDEVGQGVEAEGAVEVPVDWTHVEREGSEVSLAGDRLGEVIADLSRLGVVDRVPAHLGDDVLPEDDDLLGTELNSAWIGEKLAAVRNKMKSRHNLETFLLLDQLGEVLCDVAGDGGPGEDVGRAGICRARDEEEG